MPRQIPRFTLPLIHFTGFSGHTHRAIERLFEARANEDTGPLALMLTPSGFVNAEHPWRVRLACERDGEFSVYDAFERDEPVDDLFAIAAYHLSHDALVDRIQAPMSRHSRNRMHNRFVVTDRGILSWSWRTLAAMRADPQDFQDRINEYGIFLAYSYDTASTSNHHLLATHERLGALAAAIYRMDLASMKKKEQIGNHKDAEFSFRPVTG